MFMKSLRPWICVVSLQMTADNLIVAHASTCRWVDVVTSLQSASPALRFHEGKTARNQPEFDRDLPEISAPVSEWQLLQWAQDSYITPHAMRTTPDGWHFTSGDGHSSLDILSSGSGHRYHLVQSGGTLLDGGGSNLFLGTDVQRGPADLAAPMVLDLSYRLTDAHIGFDTPPSHSSGVVMAQVFVGLGLMFHDPVSVGLPQRFVFMQIALSGAPGPTTSKAVFICHLAGGQPQLLYGPNVAQTEFTPSAVTTSRRYDLRRFVRQMVSSSYPCGAQNFAWPAPERDLANWHLTGVYIGLETHTRDLRGGSHFSRPEGAVTAGIEISALSIRRRTDCK